MIFDKSKIPSTSGIYIFKKGIAPIYIGKSVNLKARISSHIENAKNDAKEAAIISNSDSIETIVTDSEFNALLLESKLIQKHLPKYNIRWRDDKSYLYIKITKKDKYPKCLVVRKENEKGALYYGPFSSKNIASTIVSEIRKVIPFCTQLKITNRQCFYSKIGQCDPCPNVVSKITDVQKLQKETKIYQQNIRNIIRVLNGKTDIVVKKLRSQIALETKKKNYENAIIYRDRLTRLENFAKFQSFDTENLSEFNQSEKRLQSLQSLLGNYFEIKDLKRIECYDISTMLFEDSTASMVVFIDGLSDRSEYKRFKIKDQTAQSDFEMLHEVLIRRFDNKWELPQLIVIDGGKPQVRTALTVLLNKNIQIPLIGIAKRPDRLIIGDKKLFTIRPPRHHAGFRLIQELRDESHRFAKKYHTFIRNKKHAIISVET